MEVSGVRRSWETLAICRRRERSRSRKEARAACRSSSSTFTASSSSSAARLGAARRRRAAESVRSTSRSCWAARCSALRWLQTHISSMTQASASVTHKIRIPNFPRFPY